MLPGYELVSLLKHKSHSTEGWVCKIVLDVKKVQIRDRFLFSYAKGPLDFDILWDKCKMILEVQQYTLQALWVLLITLAVNWLVSTNFVYQTNPRYSHRILLLWTRLRGPQLHVQNCTCILIVQILTPPAETGICKWNRRWCPGTLHRRYQQPCFTIT